MVSTTQIIGQTPASAESGAVDADPGPAKVVPHAAPADPAKAPVPERPALDPTRYGDWEKNGRCIDF